MANKSKFKLYDQVNVIGMETHLGVGNIHGSVKIFDGQRWVFKRIIRLRSENITATGETFLKEVPCISPVINETRLYLFSEKRLEKYHDNGQASSTKVDGTDTVKTQP